MRYGTWPSPLDPDLLATAGDLWSRFDRPEPTAEGTYWLESRSGDGRSVLVHKPFAGAARDVTPPEFDVRTGVHEYGGGGYFLDGPVVYFSNRTDGRLYRQLPDAAPHPITPEPAEPRALRYAEGVVLPDGDELLCVRESHTADGVRNELVLLPCDGSAEPRALVSDHDFVAFPCVSPDGSRIAWTTWDLPAMPFSASDVWTAELGPDGTIRRVRHVAGGPEESVFQPSWSPAGELYYVSDRSGFWNLYRERDGRQEPVSPMDAELGWPQWFCGFSTYAFLPDGQIACVVNRGAQQRVTLIAAESGHAHEPDLPFTAVGWPHIRSHGSRVAFIAASHVDTPAVVTWDAATGEHEILRRSAPPLPAEQISRPTAIEFAARDGAVGKAMHYEPRNPAVTAPADELPPLVVFAHGGPSYQTNPGLRLNIQYLTSRGIAVLDVDYGGSTGYGRAYAERLHGRWGIVDISDCVNGALHLAAQGKVDGSRMVVSGGSAGGYVVLGALAFHDAFAGGISYYGISDTRTFATETHKFESGYCDWLIGPLDSEAETYRQRSPVCFADEITSPLLLLQGLDDRVVPPGEAEQIVEALEAHGIPHRYLAFAGEGHGFRMASTLEAVWQAEGEFLAEVFGLAGSPG